MTKSTMRGWIFILVFVAALSIITSMSARDIQTIKHQGQRIEIKTITDFEKIELTEPLIEY